MTQIAIQFSPTPSQDPGDIRDNAERWMRDHPDAMALMEKLALDARLRGRRIGMKAVVERLRWEYEIERGDNTFKLNNSHTAYFARELVGRHPALAAILQFRRTKYEKGES